MSALETLGTALVIVIVVLAVVGLIVMGLLAFIDGDIDGDRDADGRARRVRANDHYVGFRQWLYELGYQRALIRAGRARDRRAEREGRDS